MDKPKIELFQAGIPSSRRDQLLPPAASETQYAAEVEKSRPNGGHRDPEVRNLLLGIAVALLCGLVFLAALSLAGPKAPLVAAGSAAVCMIVLRVMGHLGVHQQPGGQFLSAAVGGFVAMFVPLAVGLVVVLQSEQIERQSGPKEPEVSQAAPTPDLLPRLTDSFVIETPNAESDDYVRVIRDSTVAIDGKTYRVAIGELFPLFRVADEEIIVNGRDFLISLPPDILEVIRKQRPNENENDFTQLSAIAHSAPETESVTNDEFSHVDRAEITRNAQADAIKRYPALGIKDTRENRAFLETYKRLKSSESDLLNDPEWPLQLAEALAEREGWRRADIQLTPATVIAAAASDIPGDTGSNAEDFPPFDPAPPPSDEFDEIEPLPVP